MKGAVDIFYIFHESSFVQEPKNFSLTTHPSFLDGMELVLTSHDTEKKSF